MIPVIRVSRLRQASPVQRARKTQQRAAMQQQAPRARGARPAKQGPALRVIRKMQLGVRAIRHTPAQSLWIVPMAPVDHSSHSPHRGASAVPVNQMRTARHRSAATELLIMGVLPPTTNAKTTRRVFVLARCWMKKTPRTACPAKRNLPPPLILPLF